MARGLVSLSRDISPPPGRNKIDSQARNRNSRGSSEHRRQDGTKTSESLPAAIEAGRVEVRDHLEYFSKELSLVAQDVPGPRITFEDWQRLYRRNHHSKGCHFVVHQHDHPVSGVHYDLRLQFSATSSLSFAISYGLPGNANSQRPNRMAIETRVHNLWNNLIESASHATGSLLIWDTGEYEVLPRRLHRRYTRTTDDEADSDPHSASIRHPPSTTPALSQNEKLLRAFQSRHIRLRLHGTRLPANYTIALRLPRHNNHTNPPRAPTSKRRRLDPAVQKQRAEALAVTSSDSDGLADSETVDGSEAADEAVAAASDGERDAAQEVAIRVNNAYPGATNDVGSVHQRRWFLSLDRVHSGFSKSGDVDDGMGSGSGRVWKGPWEKFVVGGREVERSVLTGRKAEDVMRDEGVREFVGRKMWRAIVE